LIYTLAMGVWLFSGACGAMISRRIFQPSFNRINFLFLLLSIGLPLNVAFIRCIRQLFAGIPGAYLPLHVQLAAMMASLLPLGLLLGLLFQWAAKIYISGNRSLAVAYGIESLGGLAGGVCSSLFLRFGFQNLSVALLCALAAVGSSFLQAEDRHPKWLRALSLGIAAILMLLLWKAPGLDYFMTSWAHPNLVETKDTPYSRVTVTLLNGQNSVFENDALLFDTEGTQAEEFVHVAALQHPYPQRVLVLGGGPMGTIHEVLKHAPQTVDYVELNSTLLRTVMPHLPVEIQKSFRAGNVRIIVDDPRQFLERALGYDLILVGMPEPDSGQANRFYTREFFQQCLTKLNPHGVVAFSLRSSENYWTPPLTRRMVSIYRAARAAFPEVVVVPGGTNIVLASRDALTRDPSILAARLSASGVKTKLVSAGYLRYRYTNDRFSEVAGILESGSAPVNTDARPVCYQYTLVIWLSKFLPSARFWDFSPPEPGSGRIAILGLLLALSLPFLLLSRLRWPVRRAFLMGVAGFAGMVLETILILHFQMKNGVLYQDVGILLTGFMAGLAVGAFAAAKIYLRYRKSLGIGILLGFVVMSAVVGLRINSGASAGMTETLLWMALAGCFVAGIFAYAGLHDAGDQRRVVTPLYSADLIGGCVGSLAASLFLVPIAGLGTAAHWMVPAAMFSLLLL
jgi:spermidine synthase